MTAINNAVNTNPHVTFDANNGTLTFTSPADGAALTDLVIDLPTTNDVFIEGSEAFSLSLTNATTTTGAPIQIDPAAARVTTIINDTQIPGGSTDVPGGNQDGPGLWSITGTTNTDEGTTTQYTVQLSGVFGEAEVVTVQLGLSDISTNPSDYADILAAITDAANANNDVTFDPNTGTLTYTSPSDGAQMTPLTINLPINNDALIEGPESYTLALENPTSTTGANVALDSNADSVTTVINDTQGPGGVEDGPALWSITGPNAADEGSTPQYTVALIGTFGAGEVATVDLNLTDTNTNPSDYADILVAITAATDANPDVTFDPTTGTLTYTAPVDGSEMTPLLIDLAITNDGFIEGPESFALTLDNPTTTTGANVAIDPAADTVTTVINDTQGDGGIADGPSQWSISGPTTTDEGSTTEFTLALTGTYGDGEVLSIDIDLENLATNPDDHASFVTAVQAAADANPDVTFDPTNGTLTYTSPGDGARMTPLVIQLEITDDALIEGPEDFAVTLSNPTSTTGVDTQITDEADQIVVVIDDTQGPGGPIDGPAQWSITGPTQQNEGTTATYTVQLDGVFQADEVVTVELAITDIDTDSDDYGDIVAAIQAAIAGNPAVSFDTNNTDSNTSIGTLTYTAPADGASLPPITIDLPITADTTAEADETFVFQLGNPSSTSGVTCLLYTSPSPRDKRQSRMPSSA